MEFELLTYLPIGRYSNRWFAEVWNVKKGGLYLDNMIKITYYELKKEYVVIKNQCPNTCKDQFCVALFTDAVENSCIIVY